MKKKKTKIKLAFLVLLVTSFFTSLNGQERQFNFGLSTFQGFSKGAFSSVDFDDIRAVGYSFDYNIILAYSINESIQTYIGAGYSSIAERTKKLTYTDPPNQTYWRKHFRYSYFAIPIGIRYFFNNQWFLGLEETNYLFDKFKRYDYFYQTDEKVAVAPGNFKERKFLVMLDLSFGKMLSTNFGKIFIEPCFAFTMNSVTTDNSIYQSKHLASLGLSLTYLY